MALIPQRDPSIPQTPYNPDKPNPGIREMLRQQEFCEEIDWFRVNEALNTAHGFVYENEAWVLDVPHSSATWAGDN